MLTEIYIEALLVDEELADQIWTAWDVGEIDDLSALTVFPRPEPRPGASPKIQLCKVNIVRNVIGGTK